MRVIPWLLGAFLITACHAPRAGTVPAEPAACALDARPEVIPVESPKPGELNELFELPDSPAWWAPAPMDPEREQYHAALVARLGGDQGLRQRALLERQNAGPSARAVKSGKREADNSDRVLDGSAGEMGPASCLEWRLFQRQAHRYPMLEHPTEFGAYILRGHGRLRVYLSGGDSVGGQLRHEVSARVVADVANGFEPVAHLHNHPFMFDRKPGDRMYTTEDSVNDIGGALAPSLTDVQAYRNMRARFGLKGAWLTNGLDSIRYTVEDFDRLSAWD